MRRNKTNEEFLIEFNKLKKNFTPLEKYQSYHVKIKFKCDIDGYEWHDTPAHVLSDRGCPMCNKKVRKTNEEFLTEVKQRFDNNIDILSKYKGVDNDIKCKCKKHNYIWDTTPYSLMKGDYGCKKCAYEAWSVIQTKTNEEFITELKNVTNDEYKVIDTYIDSRTPITFLHKICGDTFKRRPSNFLIYQSCPHCIAPTKGEQKIIDCLELNNEKYTFQKSYDDLRGINNGLLSYDFYISDKNLLIEYQGEFHDGKDNEYVAQNLDRQQEHDKRKRDYAKSHNIKLLEIWYWDFENIEKILTRELEINYESLVS